ncbi:hypothetical protein C8Q74DRAFT_1312876 [Fomes fomentarius]|nr:hypothetical protein C8Q74DRAFT_1312876 [Fomes fomentarius]
MSPPNTNVKATVVVLGGTGELGVGFRVTAVLLTEYREAFPTVRIITRNPASAIFKELTEKGAEAHAFSESLDKVFAGADVVVHALPTEAVLGGRNKELVESLLKNDVKVYFPPEFDLDLRVLDFPGFEHIEWTNKKAVVAETRALAQDKMKIVSVASGSFLSWVGQLIASVHNSAKNKYKVVGPTTARWANTDLVDLARAVARLSILALDPATSAKVPDVVRIAGDNVSIEDVRDIVARVKEVEPGEIVSEDLMALKESLRRNFRIPGSASAAGKLDFTANDNELVNPGESLWKWRTVEDQLRRSH